MNRLLVSSETESVILETPNKHLYLKMCRGHENTFSREDIQTANRYMKRYQRNSNQNHLSKCLLLKRTQVTNLGENVEKRNPYVLLMRLQIDAATVENSMEGLQIIKYRTTMLSSHRISGCSLERNKTETT